MGPIISNKETLGMERIMPSLVPSMYPEDLHPVRTMASPSRFTLDGLFPDIYSLCRK